MLSIPPLIWLLVFFVVPVAIVLAFAFAKTNAIGGIDPEFTLEHFQRALDPLYFKVFGRSLAFASLSTLFSLALAFPTACFIAFAPPRVQKTLMFLVYLPLWVSLLARLYSFAIILGDDGLINRVLLALALIREPIQLLNTPLAVMAGFVYWNLLYMVPTIFAALDRMNVSLLEASMDLGAGRWTTFRRILLPQAMPGIAAGVVLCFIPTLGCFIIPDILGGPNTMMIGNLITSQFQQGRNWPFGSALSALLMLLVMATLSLYLRYYDPSKPQTAGGE